MVKRSARVAPVRPKFSSDLGSDEEDEGESFDGLLDLPPAANSPPKAQPSDGLMSSDEEPDVLTAKEIHAEVSE